MARGVRFLTTVSNPAEGLVDLSSCAREPIHIPGSIQPHGVLLVLDERGTVVQCSTNTERYFGVPHLELIGRPLDGLFEPQEVLSVDGRLGELGIGDEPTHLDTLTCSRNGLHFHVIAHRQPRATILEFEHAEAKTKDSFDLYAFVRTFTTRLRRAHDIDTLAVAVAKEIRTVTGFDRVLVYRFDRDWNGHVIAEDKARDWNSYLDLWFPESDIPQQARELYRQNRLRLIVDAEYRPVPIEPAVHPISGQPLNLRFAALRSVSPVHIEYLHNMGVRSSMSISLLTEEGGLWGLIACHHRTPHFLSFETRMACDHLGQIASMQVTLHQQREDFEQRIRLKSIATRLLQYMVEGDQFLEGLKNHPDELLAFGDAGGAALVYIDRCLTVGKCPSEDQIWGLIGALIERGREDLFVTETLASVLPDAQAYQDVASGILAISISQIHPSYLIWFRPEVVQTVKWSGDPNKPVGSTDGNMRIHPRRSFESWKQTVRGLSLPWHASETAAALELRNSIIGIVLRKAEELAQLSSELQRSNRDLEAFSYSVSHDLRAPFRHIVGYSELLKQSSTAKLEGSDARYLDVIMQSAQFAGTLVDNLLSFSRVGRAKLTLQTIASDKLVREIVSEFAAETADRRIEWQIGTLPAVAADLTMLRLVWQNLVQNAIKYTRTRKQAIIDIQSRQQGQEFVFSIRDNGIGFDQQYAGKLFGVFQRLHRMEDFEGTGVGLAHVRRIILRHGGQTWAEGIVDGGATIYFSLPIRSAGAA